MDIKDLTPDNVARAVGGTVERDGSILCCCPIHEASGTHNPSLLLTITNTRAVLEALVGKQTAFARTPKYRVESKKDRVGSKKYRKRLGWVPWVELLIGTYFASTIYYAVENENYITVPFLLLFVVGYWYTGLMSLLQGRFAGVSLGSESHTKPFPVGV